MLGAFALSIVAAGAALYFGGGPVLAWVLEHPVSALSVRQIRVGGLLTAAALADRAGVPVKSDVRLREIGLGAWEGLLRAEVEERFPGELASWIRGEDVRRGGGETYVEVGERGASAVLEALDLADGLVVAVTHGGTARSR